MTLENYLHEKYSPSTAKAYHRDIEHYLNKNPKAKTANYAAILNYLEQERRTKSAASLHRILQSIKKYYYYLLATNQRSDHPCESLKIRDHRKGDIQLQDLFTRAELDELLFLKNRYQLLASRNQLILSLLIYQAPTTGELIQLEISNLNLEQNSIYLPPTHRLNARTLALHPLQIPIAQSYLDHDRPRLLKSPSSKLLITKLGTEEKGEGISYLVSTQQKKFLKRKLNPKTIRQSVIANKLKAGEELRAVQVFAGHKNPSSTERYRQTNLGSLQEAIKKYHPMN